MSNIPRGIEVLVKKASVDPAFRAILMERRSAAAREIGLALTSEEEAMLDQIPTTQLESIINGASVEPLQRAAFMGKAGCLMLAALGVVTIGAISMPSSLGSRPGILPPNTATQPARQAGQTASGPSSGGAPRDGEQPAPRKDGP